MSSPVNDITSGTHSPQYAELFSFFEKMRRSQAYFARIRQENKMRVQAFLMNNRQEPCREVRENTVPRGTQRGTQRGTRRVPGRVPGRFTRASKKTMSAFNRDVFDLSQDLSPKRRFPRMNLNPQNI